MEVNSATYSDMTDWNKHKVVWGLKSHSHITLTANAVVEAVHMKR